ncbi:hypothetical protein BWK62_15260 [Flavobacterium oreochromis]|uniref:Uncharacterized protein n=1 Tax=Flavobacterium columnare TaxID=996 RepID=A0A246G700_9FLAO|nr:hypothetical protein BWG23_15295 [Flavobacterium oreochromis]OWP74020.1 hypothetical protein BWK62_15260 [Flavobacterium oreochromis]
MIILSCNYSQKKKIETKEKSMNTNAEIVETINKFKTKPSYSIQIDKGGCLVELIGNELPFINLFERGGFSSLIPFNANILKSGKQTLKIKIYNEGADITII